MSAPSVPEAPRDASTVVLIRDTRGIGVEVFLMRRHAQVGFLGGMHLFPGGKVEAADRDPALHALIQAHDVAEAPYRLGEDVDVPTALGLFMAAFRETFEESGLIPGAPPTMETARLAARARLGETGFLEAVRGLGAPLDLDAMEPFSRWITPLVETRRFDTRFFVAGFRNPCAAFFGDFGCAFFHSASHPGFDAQGFGDRHHALGDGGNDAAAGTAQRLAIFKGQHSHLPFRRRAVRRSI